MNFEQNPLCRLPVSCLKGYFSHANLTVSPLMSRHVIIIKNPHKTRMKILFRF